MNKNRLDVGIIGGGAAGMMCAASLLEYSCSHLHCTLYEKNENLGAKVIISGGGRCNVTTAYYRKCDIQTKYIGGWDLISYAISQFGPRQIVRRFQDHGVGMKTESDQRIFPISNDGHDIVDCFTNIFQQYSCIDVLTKTIVVQVNCLSQGGFQLKLADGSIDKVDILVITTGGNAYRHTGSTGDGYTFVQSCGHHVTQLGPSLSSFHTLEIPLHRCSGVSFEYASLSWSREGGISRGERYECEGPVLLTHFGISGPAVFIMSAHLAFRQIDATHPVIIRLKPFANYDISWWHQNFSFAVISHPRQHIINYLSHYMPHRFVHTLLNSLSIDDNIYLSQLTKEQKKILIDALGFGIKITLVARRAGDEFVTAGGISSDEINPKTLESLLCPGLYMAGEILDVDGVTGGYNLTASWASGRLVGFQIAHALCGLQEDFQG